MNTKNEDIVKSLAVDVAAISKDPRRKANFYYIDTAILLKKQLDQVLSRFNLNSPRIRVLFALISHGSTMKSKDLARPLHLTRQDISQILYSLLKYGLISKRADATDRRSFDISITRKGLDSISACLPILKKFNNLTMCALNKDDINILLNLTMKIRRSVQKISL